MRGRLERPLGEKGGGGRAGELWTRALTGRLAKWAEDPELPPKAPARGHFTLRLAFEMAFPVDSQGQSSLRTLARAVATGHYSTLPLVPPI